MRVSVDWVINLTHVSVRPPFFFFFESALLSAIDSHALPKEIQPCYIHTTSPLWTDTRCFFCWVTIGQIRPI